MATGSYHRVKRPVRGVDHPRTSSAKVKGRVELYLYSTSGLSWPVRWWPLPYTITPLFSLNQRTPELTVLIPILHSTRCWTSSCYLRIVQLPGKCRGYLTIEPVDMLTKVSPNSYPKLHTAGHRQHSRLLNTERVPQHHSTAHKKFTNMGGP